MKENRVKGLLQRHETTVGPWITIDSPDVVELLAHLGFDWMVFDMGARSTRCWSCSGADAGR